MRQFYDGQRVRVRPDLEEGVSYKTEGGLDYNIATEEMVDFAGTIVTVRHNLDDPLEYRVEEDEEDWGWTYNMFIPITTRITKTKPITQGENNVLDSDKTTR